MREEKKRKKRKSKISRFYGQNKLIFNYLALQPLGSFYHMAACRSSSKNTRKMNLTLKDKVHFLADHCGCNICSKISNFKMH
jgi:hypothetical protein